MAAILEEFIISGLFFIYMALVEMAEDWGFTFKTAFNSSVWSLDNSDFPISLSLFLSLHYPLLPFLHRIAPPP